jgi:chemotaxis protein methyltransferase CheR
MPIDQNDFDYIRQLVLRHSAIVLDSGKEYLAEARLSSVASDKGLDSVHGLVTELRRGSFGELHKNVIEAMTTNETSFFRDIHPFNALRDIVLPELIERRQTARAIRIWCAASSSGQEPYSIAMIIREHFPQLGGWRVEIVATDLSVAMLERARSGVYSQLEINRGLPAAYLVKYFTNKGIDWHIDPSIRNMVDYRELNLAEPWPPMPEMDIVFIRNVLIYFDVETKKAILGRIRKNLKNDGFLFLGGAETTINIDDAYERQPMGKAVCYRLRTEKEATHGIL